MGRSFIIFIWFIALLTLGTLSLLGTETTETNGETKHTENGSHATEAAENNEADDSQSEASVSPFESNNTLPSAEDAGILPLDQYKLAEIDSTQLKPIKHELPTSTSNATTEKTAAEANSSKEHLHMARPGILEDKHIPEEGTFVDLHPVQNERSPEPEASGESKEEIHSPDLEHGEWHEVGEPESVPPSSAHQSVHFTNPHDSLGGDGVHSAHESSNAAASLPNHNLHPDAEITFGTIYPDSHSDENATADSAGVEAHAGQIHSPEATHSEPKHTRMVETSHGSESIPMLEEAKESFAILINRLDDSTYDLIRAEMKDDPEPVTTAIRNMTHVLQIIIERASHPDSPQLSSAVESAARSMAIHMDRLDVAHQERDARKVSILIGQVTTMVRKLDKLMADVASDQTDPAPVSERSQGHHSGELAH